MIAVATRDAARLLLRLALVAAGTLLIALAVLTLSARLVLPFAASHKGAIEARLGERLGHPVTIGELDLRWRADGPVLRIEDVSVRESATREVTFDELLVDVDLVASLRRMKPIVDELTLVGADLSIEYSGDGDFRLHGVERSAAGERGGAGRADGEDGEGSDHEGSDREGGEGRADGSTGAKGSVETGLDVVAWLLDAGRVGLLDTRVTFVDTARGRRLVVRDLNVRVQNEGRSHRLRVELALPPELGGAFEAGLDLEGSGDALAVSDGSVYARASGLRLAAWRALRDGPNATVDTAADRAVDATADVAADVAADMAASTTAGVGAFGAALESAFERLDGEAQVELWGRWEGGEMRHARARLDARELVLRAPGPVVAPAAPLLDTLSADLVYRDAAPGWTLAADRVELVARGERAVLENLELGRGARADGRWHGEARGARLPLGLVARLATTLLADAPGVDAPEVDVSGVDVSEVDPPAADAPGVDAPGTSAPGRAATTLAALAPDGALRDWRARVAFGGETTPTLSLDADLEALSFAASGALPGVDALDGTIRLVDNRGSVSLAGRELTLAREGATLAVDAVDVAFDVDARIPGQARLDGRVALARESVEAEAQVDVTLAAGRSPHLDVRARYGAGDVADVAPWLAVAPVPAKLARWFEHALVAGRMENGELVWFGRLADFPYAGARGSDASAEALEPGSPAAGQGVFESGFDVVDATLAFRPGWPPARIGRGRVEIDGATLIGRSTDARLAELDVRGVRVRIADLRRPRLALEGSGRAALRSLVAFARDGPLERVLGEVLAETAGSGRAGLDLTLEMPLARGAGGPLALDGALFLDGNELTFGRANLTLENARGSIGFSERGVRIGALRATAFGRRVSIHGATSGRGERALTELRLDGVLEAADVLAHYGIPLDRFARGASRWRVALSVPHAPARLRRDGVRLLAESDLVGTRLLLPAPLAKPSAEAVPLSLSSAFRVGATRTLWRIDHASRLRVALETDASGLFSLGARFGDGAVRAPPDRGIALDGRAPRLALDGWATAIANVVEALPEAPGGPVPIPPIRADIATDALLAGGVSLGAATLHATSDDDYLDAVVANPHLAGSVRYPREHWIRERVARVRVAHVDRTLVDALASAPDDGGPSAALDPRRFTAIDAHVSSLGWDALALRDVTLRARPGPRGLTFELETTLAGGTTLSGRGSWLLGEPGGRAATSAEARRPERHASALDLALVGRDLGAGLAAAGLPGMLAEGAGEVRATFGWKGPLYGPELVRTRGSLSLDIARGRIVPLEPGPARLVGLFALQALPRRLVLDFRDVTSDGLAFERIDGDIALAGGVADVGLVRLTGPVGVVDVSGTSDLVRREYDQRIAVLPRVSAALPLIGAIAGGVSGGIGALVAGGFLKALGVDLDRIGLRRYTLTGSWDDPVLAPLKASPRSIERGPTVTRE